ncbi:MAG: hypothetical protein M5U16_05790 [Hyphomicrobium sp.]|nr:hypothetical protein [Hyphomicrobium sp.]
MAKRVAVIVGSTGAIGRQLMPLLLASPRFDNIVVLHHRLTQYAELPRVKERIVDFSRIPPPPAGEDVEAVFCCVGTTQKKGWVYRGFSEGRSRYSDRLGEMGGRA